MLYSNPAPSGAVTTMVPVVTAQVGCVTVSVGATGGVAAVSVTAVTGDTQVLSVVLLTVTL